MSDLQIQLENLIEKKLSSDKYVESQIFQEVEREFPDCKEQVMFILDYVSSCKAHRSLGWLPYYPQTFELAKRCGNNIRLLDTELSNFYSRKWHWIREEILSDLENYCIAKEAKLTLEEALIAHDKNLYRCVCRVLPPEIERLIRYQRNLDQWEIIKTSDIQDEILKDMTRENFLTFNPHGVEYILYVLGYFYRAASKKNLKKYKVLYQSIPNRHAALHGNITYSSFKTSVNMILLTYATFTYFHNKQLAERGV